MHGGEVTSFAWVRVASVRCGVGFTAWVARATQAETGDGDPRRCLTGFAWVVAGSAVRVAGL